MHARVRGAVYYASALVLAGVVTYTFASSEEKPVARTYEAQAKAPERRPPRRRTRKSEGCISCHTATDRATMHANAAVVLGCTDCHGGDAAKMKPAGTTPTRLRVRRGARRGARPAALSGGAGSSRRAPIPSDSYTLLNRESREYVRFVNPGDYRVAREACGACHLPTIQAVERSLMSTSAMLWGGASYNNGILPYKSYILGEAYTERGRGRGGGQSGRADRRR